ncbi:hypothetical protein [Catellatospora methionotrophica]|uniref:hypothetical protein n=1 Tax=Catellatospora methionotrophica TaxID=121620 RepID=UPI0033E041AE
MKDEDVLGAFREDPLPPSRVDVARAVRAGRRRQRLRAAGAAGAAVLVLTAGGVAGSSLLGDGGLVQPSTSPGVSQAPSTCPIPSPRTEPPPSPVGAAPAVYTRLRDAAASQSPAVGGAAPAEFAVLRNWIDVGVLTRPQGQPSDLQVQHLTTARYWQHVRLHDRAKRYRVEVMVFAGDGKPVFGPPGRRGGALDMTGAEPAGEVGGRPAAWVPGRQGLDQFDAARLGWQWADGGWAFVAVADTAQGFETQATAAELAILRAKARQVASVLTIGPSAPVTIPFSVPGVPECSRLTQAGLSRGTHDDGTPSSRVALRFDQVDDTDPYGYQPAVATTIVADSVATPPDAPGAVTEQIDGHPAQVSDDALVLYGVDGYALEVSGPMNREQLIAYARAVRVVPGARGDESKWTDEPIRPS